MTVILTILTDPPGCQVLINGDAKGTTNSEGKLVFAKLPLAHYDVEVRKDGFGPLKKGFQAGAESPTLVFKLIASLDDQVNQFNQLVGAGKLIGPESPNAFELSSSLSAKYPDRAEVANMRSTLLPKVTAIADAAVNSTLQKWRSVTRAEIEGGQTAAECVASLKADDNRAKAKVAYLKGVLAMRDWLKAAPSQDSGSPGGSPASGSDGKTTPDLAAAARDSFGSAVQLDPTWAAPNYQLGRLLLFSGSAEAAQSSFTKAIQLEPNWAAPHIGLADAYYAAGKRKDSIAEYQKAIKQESGNAAAFAGLGLARSTGGDSREGLKDIDRAIQLDPSSGLGHLSLGMVYSESKKKKDRERAVEELGEAIKKNPDNLEFQNKIAQRLISQIKERDKK